MRIALSLIVSLAFVSAAYPQTPPVSDRLALYASEGPELMHYELDAVAATLTKRASVTLPEDVQYAWPHQSRRILYVAWSDGAGGHDHGVTAFDIDSASGAIGAQVVAPARLDAGVYAHQIRVDPSNQFAILVTRGNGPAGGKPEDPGALKVFGYNNGTLTNRASVAPGGGIDFQPRHLDFHPSKPWVYVSLERQNKLQVYLKQSDGIRSAPLFTKDSLTAPEHVVAGQAAGTVHVHPNGRFVYQANRANGTTAFQGENVFAGGENTIAVWAINQDTGEPRLIQNIDTRGMRPRTFALDPAARVLVAANQEPVLVRDGELVKNLPASLAVFRVRADGKLDFVRKYDVAASATRSLLWMGIVR